MKNIPEDLSNKIKTSLQTPANNADPKMSITVVRAKDTIMDNTYWTTEVIRTKPGLGDLSVAPRRFNPYGSPNRIYEINIQNGIVATSIREYPDKFKEGWKEQFTLGPGKSVAVAFNGEWKYYKKRYRLVTDEKPWISWVDLDGNLFVQLWDEENTKIQLSSNVTKVKMIRAWKNTVVHYLDQGIVAAYIKTDGKVYYRNFCIQENYTEAWEYEKQLNDFTGDAVNVNLFITNDYRMGFIIEDTLGQIHWLVTHRNWGGMASPAENLVAGLKDIKFEITPIKYYETYNEDHITTSIDGIFFNVAEPIYPIPIAAHNGDTEEEEKIWLKFSHPPVEQVEDSVIAFTLKDSIGTLFPILSIERDEEDPSVILFNTGSFTSMNTNLTITYDRTQYPLNAENQGSLFAIESFTLTFIPALTPPEGYLQENVVFDIAPIFNVTQVYYCDGYTQENLQMGISNISLVVTKVGDNPL